MKVCGSRHCRWCSGGLEKYSRGLQRRFSSRACDTRIPYLSLTHTHRSPGLSQTVISLLSAITRPPPDPPSVPPCLLFSLLLVVCTGAVYLLAARHKGGTTGGKAVNRVSGGGRGVGVVGVLTARTSIRGGC